MGRIRVGIGPDRAGVRTMEDFKFAAGPEAGPAGTVKPAEPLSVSTDGHESKSHCSSVGSRAAYSPDSERRWTETPTLPGVLMLTARDSEPRDTNPGRAGREHVTAWASRGPGRLGATPGRAPVSRTMLWFPSVTGVGINICYGNEESSKCSQSLAPRISSSSRRHSL